VRLEILVVPNLPIQTINHTYMPRGVLVECGTGLRQRTDWGNLLPPTNAPQPPAPGLPGPEDIGPTVRPPEW